MRLNYTTFTTFTYIYIHCIYYDNIKITYSIIWSDELRRTINQRGVPNSVIVEATIVNLGDDPLGLHLTSRH